MDLVDIPPAFQPADLYEIGRDPTTDEEIWLLVGQSSYQAFARFAFTTGAAAVIQRRATGYNTIDLKRLPATARQIRFDLRPLAIAIRKAELFHNSKALWPDDDLANEEGPSDLPQWRYLPLINRLINSHRQPSSIPFDQMIEIVQTELRRQLEEAAPAS